MSVTLITPTGNRPEAFALCEKYMARQTYKGPLQWIVVDDCDIPTNCTLNQEYYRSLVTWREGYNTQRANMEMALKHVKNDYVLIIEDDDWYHPQYIETMVYFLKQAAVVGEGNAKYYSLNVPGYKEMRNMSHASLCQTGVRKDALELLLAAVTSGEMYFDVHLWREAHKKEVFTNVFSHRNLCIGIKGMPGRGGLGVGHRQKDYLYDSGLKKLTEWIGADVALYQPYIKQRNANPTRQTKTLRQSNRGLPQQRRLQTEVQKQSRTRSVIQAKEKIQK